MGGVILPCRNDFVTVFLKSLVWPLGLLTFKSLQCPSWIPIETPEMGNFLFREPAGTR